MSIILMPCSALALATACVSDADPLTPVGNAGSGGSGTGGNGTAGTSSAGTSSAGTGTGGTTSGSIQDDPAFAVQDVCPAPAGLITDFPPVVPVAPADAGSDAGDGGAAVPPNTTATTFGDFTTTLSGGTYIYPGPPSQYEVSSDVSQGNWRISGDIGDYSGFGLYLSECNMINATGFGGLAFTISGNVGTLDTLTLTVGIAENEISHLWLLANVAGSTAMPNAGRCLPTSGQYDGSCGAPTFSVPVTAEPTTVTVRWDQFAAGSPRADVNPAEITTISWVFPSPPGAGTAAPTPYPADVVIDDIRFVP